MPSTLPLDGVVWRHLGELTELQGSVNQFLQPVQRGADSAPGHVDQSSQIEHHLRWDERRLQQVDNKPQNKVTTENYVMCLTYLVLRRLNMKDIVYVRIHETSIQIQLLQEPGAW